MEAGQFLRWRVGDARITRILDVEVSGMAFLIPGAVPDRLRAIGWLGRWLAPDGQALAAIQSYLVEIGGRRILVDSGAGLEARAGIPARLERARPYLDDLAAAGFPPESIDLVLHTHLHFDHVGWNVRQTPRGPVPTFPRARHLVVGQEWARWSDAEAEDPRAPVGQAISPLMEAGRVDFVDPGGEIAPGVLLEPTPGHTRGHVSPRIRSRGEEAVITGDVMHLPAQIARPDWACTWDDDASLATATRARFLAECARSSRLVIGTHFARAPAGYVVWDGEGHRFVPRPPFD